MTISLPRLATASTTQCSTSSARWSQYHSVNEEAPNEALLGAVNELSVERVNVLPEDFCLTLRIRRRKPPTNILYRENIDGGLLLRWDMTAIGPVTDYLETALSTRFRINTCHPWEDDTECICYATDEPLSILHPQNLMTI